MTDVPAWLTGVAAALERDRPTWFTMFEPPADPARRSAVMLLFCQGHQGVEVVLTERPATMSAHASQVVFPGGHLDPVDDGDPVAAALRETQEEVGIDPAAVVVVAELPALYLHPTGNAVSPVLGWWPDPHPLTVVDPREVARVARARLPEILDPANRFSVRLPGTDYQGPGFAVDGLFVWGFTATLLDHVLHLAGLTRTWDSSLERPLPQHLLDPYL